MGRGVRIGRVSGIPLVIHVSWLVSLAVIVVVGRELWSPVGGLGAYALSLAFGLTFFSSVVAHELSHALAARALGIPTADITLFVFGGVARITSEPEEPGGEVLMALAGPLASITLAGSCLLAAAPLDGTPRVFLELVGIANLTVGVFNLLPGFPLDGGRITRALLWRLRGERLWATRVAAWLGRTLALLLVLVGLAATIVTRSPRFLLEIVLGLFLWQAAAQGEWLARHLETLRSRTVADYMTPVAPGARRARTGGPVVVPAWAIVADLAAVGSAPTEGDPLLVIGGAGQPLGRLQRARLAGVPPVRWSALTAGALAEPVASSSHVRHDERADRFLTRAGTGGASAEYIVVDAAGRLVGVMDTAASERLRALPSRARARRRRRTR
jgi:Zn-dependent protease